MKRYTAPHVLAMEFCWDYSDLQDYRYHYGRTDRPVYAIGEKYYCASPNGKGPAKYYGDKYRFEWKECVSSFADSIGWTIYESK